MRSTPRRAVAPIVLSAAALLALAAAGCGAADKAFCANGNCGWPEQEATRISSLSNLPASPPTDTTNRYFGNAAAEQLGRQFFWDPRFSGVSTGLDSLKRPMPFGRAPKGQPLNIACVTCHDLNRGGVDPASVPGNVSIGASWDSVNASTMFNDAFRPVLLWAGRSDSLWGQAPGVIETAMGSNRLRAAWTIASTYRAPYTAVFTDYPLPAQMAGTINDVTPTLETAGALAGQCKLSGGACPAGCRAVQNAAATATGCFPRFPLDGKPGASMGCQPGDASEPFGDAWDCMDPADQQSTVRILVNFGKAIGAFEARLISRNSAFDAFADDLRAGHANESTAISPDAKNGARLFVGKAGCSDCHNTPLFTDDNFYNVGIPQMGEAVPSMDDCPVGGVCDCVTPNNCIPFGAFDGIQKLHKQPYLRTSPWSDNPEDTSSKRYLDMTPESVAKGSWRTPSLRDVALTAPYMHTGALATLEDVIEHYNRGASALPNGDPDGRIKPLFLSDQEKNQLVAFLKTLTGEPLPTELRDPPTLP